jgi:hypothetical protein
VLLGINCCSYLLLLTRLEEVDLRLSYRIGSQGWREEEGVFTSHSYSGDTQQCLEAF